jgi:hypothetical protein
MAGWSYPILRQKHHETAMLCPSDAMCLSDDPASDRDRFPKVRFRANGETRVYDLKPFPKVTGNSFKLGRPAVFHE